MDEIINLTPVKGNSYDKVRDFYERLSKNFDALQTLGEEDMLWGFVMTTLKKLPQVKPDLVRDDDNWEEWDMNELIENLRKWLKETRLMILLLTVGTHVEGNGSGTQRKNGKMAANLEPPFVYTVKATTGESL